MISFWDVTPYSLVDIYQRFGGICCLHPLDRWAKTFVGLPFYIIPRRYRTGWSSGDVLRLYLTDARFESPPGRQLSWLGYFMVFLSPARRWGPAENYEKSVSKDSWCPGRDSNRAPPDYVSTVLPLRPPARFVVISFAHLNWAGSHRGALHVA
jgi:hypothetical protein